MNAFEIKQDFINLMNTASDDLTRVSLNSIHLSKQKKRAEATNGHILGIVEMPELKNLKKSVLVSFKPFKLGNSRAFMFLDKGMIIAIKDVGADFTDLDDAGLWTLMNGLDESFKKRLFSVDVKDTKKVPYPNVDAVLPKDEPVYRIALNADLLQTLSRIVSFEQRVSGQVIMEFPADAHKPMVVKNMKGKGFAILMPLRPIEANLLTGVQTEAVKRLCADFAPPKKAKKK